MRRILVLLCVLACLTVASVACSKGANPMAPTSVGGGGGTAVLTGDLDVTYERPEDVHQKVLAGAPGTIDGCDEYDVRLHNTPGGWPGGFYVGGSSTDRSVSMTKVSDRVFKVLVRGAPSGGDLALSVSDMCHNNYPYNGSGLTVNGVRLRDEAHWAHFAHQPGIQPSITTR